ncbi:MAG: MFS transporter [Bradyrhizobiaceae bacterium]|nr:MFS transporter [Bradyrhizobiaceae bacterium]
MQYQPAGPSRQSLRGLDWFVFLVADVQTGFGPFVAVYLTEHKWTQIDIGLVLTVAGMTSLLGQMPGGIIVDTARSERMVAGIGVAAIAVSALAYALSPIFAVILVAAALQAAASCVLGPAIAAISLGLVGHDDIGERLGRNARFASLGNGFAAAAMGAFGYLVSVRAVFFITAGLLAPALAVLSRISAEEIDAERAHGGPRDHERSRLLPGLVGMLRRRPLLIFAACLMLFHFANAAMLPLMGSVLTMRSSQQWAVLMIAASIVGPQVVVAMFSPFVGNKARTWGRRPLLLAAFAVLPVRGVLFAVVTNPVALVVVQLLDGVSAAVFAVLVPLVIADITRGSGHFNLGQGIVGTTIGIGASMSPTYAGYLTDHFSSRTAFLGLAAIAVLGVAITWLLMPETRRAR